MALNIERNIEALEHTASTRGGVWVFVVAALRSRYFVMSLAFYAALLLLLGGHVISVYVAERGIFGETEELLVLPERTPPPPRPPEEPTRAETREVAVSATTPTAESPVARVMLDAPSAFVPPPDHTVAPPIRPNGIRVETHLSKQIQAERIRRYRAVRDFMEDWKVRDWHTPRRMRAEFTIFKAKYQDGDWNCNPTDLENLMLQIRRWSSDRIKANLHPEVLDIGTEKLFEIKPPFVYLTGHKDFRLLDSEVTNLRDYLRLGGAIWADSALAGRRSRFDLAFRREMRRVLPDREFETVGLDHPMFNTFFSNIDLPSGMNYYQEPVEVINIGDELAVIYTLNGYGHFWEVRLNERDEIERTRLTVGYDERYDPPLPIHRHVWGPKYPNREPRFRNMTDETVRNSYRFALNVVVHLLIRYQEHFRFLPLELPEPTGMR